MPSPEEYDRFRRENPDASQYAFDEFAKKFSGPSQEMYMKALEKNVEAQTKIVELERELVEVKKYYEKKLAEKEKIIANLLQPKDHAKPIED